MDNQTQQTGPGKAAERYSQLEPARRPYLDRGRECAALTIPMLLPREGHSATSKYPKPWQSLGARGLKNLGAKSVTALFPPNTPFWRYMLDEEAHAQLDQAQDKTVKTKFEKALSKVERMVQDRFETSMARPKLMEVALQGLCVGNVLVHIQDNGGLRAFRLDSYCVKRDAVGNLLECLTKEVVSPVTLDESVRQACAVTGQDKLDKEVHIYTWLKREAKGYRVHQEINGFTVPESEGTYTMEACPWIALRLYAVDGEDYGRSYVEEHLGDLITYESLNKSVTEASAIAAKHWFFVRPGSVIKKAVLEKTPNGGMVDGSAADITTMQVNKGNDLRVAYELLGAKKSDLSFAFLLNSAVARDAERVTKAEIMQVAQELDDVLGGLYSIWTNELQLPYVRVLLSQLQSEGVLPEMPKGIANPVPTTGLAALGRGNDFDKLRTLLAVLTEAGLTQAINQSEVAERAALALGVDTDGLVKSQDELMQEQMQMAMLQAGQAAAPKVAEAAMNQQAEPMA